MKENRPAAIMLTDENNEERLVLMWPKRMLNFFAQSPRIKNLEEMAENVLACKNISSEDDEAIKNMDALFDLFDEEVATLTHDKIFAIVPAMVESFLDTEDPLNPVFEDDDEIIFNFAEKLVHLKVLSAQIAENESIMSTAYFVLDFVSTIKTLKLIA